MEYRNKLIPHIIDYDKLSLKALPNLTFFNQPNFRSNSVNTDPYGIRFGNKKELENKKNVFDLIENDKKETILAVGGSTLFGVGASSDKETIPSLLEKETNKNIINMSGRALNGFQEIILILSHISNIKNLSKIIIFSGLNDFYLNKNFYNYFPGNIFNNKNFIEQTNQIFERKVSKIKVFLKDLLSFNSKKKSSFPKITFEDIINRNFNIYEILSKSLNVPVIYFLQPNIYWCKNYSKEEIKLLDEIQKNENHKLVYNIRTVDHQLEYNSLLEKKAKKYNIEFYDTNKYFTDNSKKDEWLFVDTLHLTDEGNKFSVKFLKDKI